MPTEQGNQETEEYIQDKYYHKVPGRLVHRLISRRHTAVGDLADFQGASDEHTLIRT